MKTGRKRSCTRLFSVLLAFCLMLSVVAPLTVFADEADGNPWVQDEATVAGGEVCEVVDGEWIHLASSGNNSNGGVNAPPAVFVSTNQTFGEEGTLEFTMKSGNPSSDRFGVYLGYVNSALGMFFGYDNDGWFWQKYDGAGNAWYDGSRVGVPAANTETPIRITWADSAASLYVNGQLVFENISYESFADQLSDKIAIKCGSYTNNETTSVYIKDPTANLVQVTKYSVDGVVVDDKGVVVSGATVTLGAETTTTNAAGEFSFANLAAGEYTVAVTKADYVSATKAFTISDANVNLGNVAIAAIAKVKYGDVNEDKAINAADAVLVLQKFANILSDGEKFNAVNANVNGDEAINAADAVLILQYFAGIISSFPVEELDPNPPIPDDASAVKLTSKAGDNGIYMDVQVDPTYPRVQKYTMHGTSKVEGKEMAGQTDKLSTVVINGVSLTPEITSVVSDDKTSITYTIPCKSASDNIDCVLTAVLKVEGDTLELRITNIENKLVRETYPVQTINFPNQSLVSVQDNQNNANLMASIVSSYTYISGDEFVDFSAGETPAKSAYNYAVISNSDLSASVESNTMYDKSGSGIGYGGMTDGDNVRVAVSVQNKGDYKSLGLASSQWVYDSILASYDADRTSTFVKYYDETDMPYVRVAIAGDENGDDKIDWNDGAVAFRDISHYIPGSETVPDHVTYRIAMNFGGQAQNPFLTTLDNAKKVALHTEGLGQSILLKGYGNEGHDSGHPDYADIGARIGGAEDMLTLLNEGAKYGATFGIHINASEMYPESEAFCEEMVNRTTSGGLSYGWNWIDQGISINGIYDLVSGNRTNRLQALFDEVGTALDFLYLDVWGNGVSGNEDTITTRNVGHDITKFGWRMGNEWGIGVDWYATMQHWAADLAYGGDGAKGFNSTLMRFIRNSQKDSWIADCASYDGAANGPLLGGMEMYDFEGWQGRNDYDEYIRTVYSHNVTTKFIQHFEAIKWVDSENSYTTKQGQQWTPEMYIELADKNGNLITLTRGSDDPTSPAYRDRTITYNGVVVSKGAATTGATSVSARITGTEAYLIPWFWGSDGKALADADMKLYHWNCKGGTTEWTLVDEWKDCSSVMVYKLTDTGKADGTEVQVVNGKISITADAETPYVVYKGEKAQMEVEWSTGMHLTDVGFNSGSLDVWNVTGSASIAKSQYSNPMLKLTGVASASQVMTDLVPGTKYAVYVGVDNRSTGNASITLTDSTGTVLDSNYTNTSIARNYIKAYAHSTSSATVGGTSYFQNMYVYFTAPQSGSVTVKLSHEGSGDVYFDDVRVVENDFNGIVKDTDGKLVSYENDFENNAQGVYPFVLGDIEGVEDNRTHLSELHAPYTQAGWDVKKLDDVIGGEWSVKANGLYGRNRIVMQTIPQNIRFEPGVKYTVAFDYEMGSEGTYELIIGDNTSIVSRIPLQKTLGEGITGITTSEADGYVNEATVKRCVFTITGAQDGQSWFGIYSTSTAADTQGTSGSTSAFGGYLDFVLDNVKVVKSDADWSALNTAIAAAIALDVRDYTEATWSAMQTALTAAQNLLNNIGAAQDAITTAATNLNNAINALSRISANISGKVVDGSSNGIANATVTLRADGESNRTAKTGADGSYSFTNIPIRNYTIMVTASGYSARYNVAVGTLAQGNNTVANITLNAKSGDYDYSNEFDNADSVSGVENLAGNTGNVTVSHNNQALRIAFPGGGRNNVVLADAGEFVNSKIEFDLTPQASSVRFGVVFRATEMNSRVFVGVGDDTDKYFYEYWNGGSNAWSSMYSGTAMQAGTKYHVVAELKGSTIKMSVDGVEVVNQNIQNASLPESGYIGFECRSAAAFNIDNIKITDLGA